MSFPTFHEGTIHHLRIVDIFIASNQYMNGFYLYMLQGFITHQLQRIVREWEFQWPGSGIHLIDSPYAHACCLFYSIKLAHA